MAANELAAGLSSAIFLGVLLLAAIGWTLTRSALTSRERSVSGVIFILYISIGAVKAFCASESNFCGAYMLTEYVRAQATRDKTHAVLTCHSI